MAFCLFLCTDTALVKAANEHHVTKSSDPACPYSSWQYLRVDHFLFKMALGFSDTMCTCFSSCFNGYSSLVSACCFLFSSALKYWAAAGILSLLYLYNSSLVMSLGPILEISSLCTWPPNLFLHLWPLIGIQTHISNSPLDTSSWISRKLFKQISLTSLKSLTMTLC